MENERRREEISSPKRSTNLQVIHHPYQQKFEQLQHPKVNRFTKLLDGSIVMQNMRVKNCYFCCMSAREAPAGWRSTPFVRCFTRGGGLRRVRSFQLDE